MSSRRPRPYTKDEIHDVMKEINKRLLIATSVLAVVGLVIIGLVAIFS